MKNFDNYAGCRGLSRAVFYKAMMAFFFYFFSLQIMEAQNFEPNKVKVKLQAIGGLPDNPSATALQQVFASSLLYLLTGERILKPLPSESGERASKVEKTKHVSKPSSEFRARPVPATDFLEIEFPSRIVLGGVVQLTDLTGRVLLRTAFESGKNAQPLRLNVATLPRGMMTLSIFENGMPVQSSRVLLQSN